MDWNDVPADAKARLVKLGRATTDDAKAAVMARILAAWQRAPELRLGQFITCATLGRRDVFDIEDEELAVLCEDFAPRLTL